MKILIAVLGTFGDLNPMLGLAEELMARGHQVTIATNKCHEGEVLSSGVAYYEIKPDYMPYEEKFYNDPIQQEILYFDNIARPTLLSTYLLLEKILKGHDIFVSNSNVHTSYFLAAAIKVPWILAILSPYSTGLPPREESRFPSWMPDSYILIDKLLPHINKTIASIISVLRTSIAYNRTFTPISEFLRLCLFSKHLCGVPKYWGENIGVTGFIFRDQKRTWPEGLKKFLESGSAPIVMTFGSAVTTMLGASFYEPFAKAVKGLNRRMIILAGDLSDELQLIYKDQPYMFIAKEAQNSKLFPQSAFVIHHGGIGTFAEALRAKKASLIVPFTRDQPLNAYLAEEHKIGLHLSYKDWSEDKIAGPISELLNNKLYEENVLRFAAKMSEEDGIKTASDAIESYARDRGIKRAMA
jgi:UDP:flavonoid glycosyltransferase YjiC (YdhE family)